MNSDFAVSKAVSPETGERTRFMDTQLDEDLQTQFQKYRQHVHDIRNAATEIVEVSDSDTATEKGDVDFGNLDDKLFYKEGRLIVPKLAKVTFDEVFSFQNLESKELMSKICKALTDEDANTVANFGMLIHSLVGSLDRMFISKAEFEEYIKARYILDKNPRTQCSTLFEFATMENIMGWMRADFADQKGLHPAGPYSEARKLTMFRNRFMRKDLYDEYDKFYHCANVSSREASGVIAPKDYLLIYSEDGISSPLLHERIDDPPFNFRELEPQVLVDRIWGMSPYHATAVQVSGCAFFFQTIVDGLKKVKKSDFVFPNQSSVSTQ